MYALQERCVLQRTGSRWRVPIRCADAGDGNVSVHQQIPLLWYQESTAFVATLKATCPSYDAIIGKQPASCRVSRSAGIGPRIVIKKLILIWHSECNNHPSDTTHGRWFGLHVCEWARFSSLFYGVLIGPQCGMAHQPDSLAAARCSVTWCNSSLCVDDAGGGNRRDGRLQERCLPEEHLGFAAPTVCTQRATIAPPGTPHCQEYIGRSNSVMLRTDGVCTASSLVAGQT